MSDYSRPSAQVELSSGRTVHLTYEVGEPEPDVGIKGHYLNDWWTDPADLTLTRDEVREIEDYLDNLISDREYH